MVDLKLLADVVTFVRVIIGLVLVWLGLTEGVNALAWAAWLMIVDWMGDLLDGGLAHLSRVQRATWIGDHDLLVDMAVSVGLLIFMLGAGLVSPPVAWLYLAFGILYFWHFGIQRGPGMLYQAPIYAWFIWVAIRDLPNVGLWMITWIIAAVVLTWPRFPNQVIPGFLKAMADAISTLHLHLPGHRGA